MKKIWAIVASFILLLVLLPSMVIKANALVPTSGTCGTNLTWSYDSGTKSLYIEGTGAMNNYLPGVSGKEQPWEGLASEIKYVSVGSGVTGIGDMAFYDCSALKLASLASSVTSIGSNAFDGTGLEYIYIPSNVTTIKSYAFNGISRVWYNGNAADNQNNNWGAVKKCDPSKAGDSLTFSCTSDGDSRQLKISGTGPMYDRADEFEMELIPWNTENFDEVLIDSNVTSVGSRAFAGNANITKVIILSENNYSINDEAFSGCNMLSYVYLSESVTSIGKKAFDGTGLEELVVTEAATVGKNAFSTVETVYYPGTSQSSWSSTDTYYIDISKPGPNITFTYNSTTKTLTFTGKGNMNPVPDTFCDMRNIPWHRYWSEAEKVVIGEGITSVTDSGFENFTELKSVSLPKTLINIGEYTFGSCEKLKSVNIPEGVRFIGGSAFSNCNSLETVSLPSTLSDYGQRIFLGCSGLKTVTLAEGIRYISSYMFSGSGLESISIPSTVLTINTGAFYNCTALKSVLIPVGVGLIGNEAFEGVEKIYYSGTAVDAQGNNWGAQYIDKTVGAGCSHPEKNASHNIIEDATCIKAGKEIVTCKLCGLSQNKTINPTGKHNYQTKVTPATTKKNGKSVEKCSVCGNEKSAKTIYYPKTIKLSSTSVTYTGQAIKPSVKVTDAKGKTISKTYYSVKYSSNKNIGTAKAEVVFKGNYSGRVTLKFNIVPKATKISSIKNSAAGTVTVKWAKVSGVSGYEVKLVDGKTSKVYDIKSGSTVKKDITKLKAGKTYKVYVRCYKKVGKEKFYSDYTSVKKITVKN